MASNTHEHKLTGRRSEGELRMRADNGDLVRVHYRGRLQDGSEFDSSFDGEPLEFGIGGEDVISGFENAVLGMTVGEKKTVLIPSENAYGVYRYDLKIIVERDSLPDEVEVELGEEYQVKQENGDPFLVRVTQIDGAKVTLDANHPLAGEDLTFDLQLEEVIRE
jgi:peptidylprolyl isomerase